MNITFRILSKVQAAYCQELLDSIATKRIEIIQAAMIDHITDKPRGRQPTASKTIARIDAETAFFTAETHKTISKLGCKKTRYDIKDKSYAINSAREKYDKYHILYKQGSEYLLFKAISSTPI